MRAQRPVAPDEAVLLRSTRLSQPGAGLHCATFDGLALAIERSVMVCAEVSCVPAKCAEYVVGEDRGVAQHGWALAQVVIRRLHSCRTSMPPTAADLSALGWPDYAVLRAGTVVARHVGHCLRAVRLARVLSAGIFATSRGQSFI